jgi:hypothetical protein
MTERVNLNFRNPRLALSVGLAVITLAMVLTYVLGAQVILKSPYAEPGHELFMSVYMPLMHGMQGLLGQTSQSQQIHGSFSLQSQMQADPHASSPASESQMDTGPKAPNQFGIIGNNILGSPTGLSAGGLAAVVVYSVIPLAAAAFVVSWSQRSFVVAGLLAASGIILMTLPLTNMNFVFPGPIIGVVVGLAILGLGVTKGIKKARTLMAAPK